MKLRRGGEQKAGSISDMPASPAWRDELLKVHDAIEGPLPQVRNPVSPEELQGYLGRDDVAGALGVSGHDLDFARALASAGNAPLKQLGVSVRSHEYRLALAVHLERRTGISFRPDGFLSVDADRLDEADNILFAPNTSFMGHSDWRMALSRSDVKGVFQHQDGSVRPTFFGEPLTSVANANFFHVKVGDEFRSMQGGILRVSPEKGVIVPIVGEFMGEDGPIPDERLAQLGIERVRDTEGRPVTYPMFASTARSLIQFCSFQIHVPVVDGRPRLLNGPEAILDVFSMLGDESADGLREAARMLLDGAYEDAKPGMPKEAFVENQWGKALTMAGTTVLQNIDAPEVTEYLTWMSLPVCAVQFKGGGCVHYDGNYVTLTEGEVRKHPNLRFKERRGDWSFVVDRRHEGQQGIMLSIPHQPGSMDPVGGAPTLEAIGYEREQRILEHGGVLSGVTIGVIKLFDDTQVPDLCVPDAAVTVVAILDDTRRVEDFIRTERNPKAREHWYKEAVVEKYGPAPPEVKSGDEWEAWVDSQFIECREKHLAQLCLNLGKTTRATLEANLTNPRNQNLMGNISFAGGITDTRALAEMTDPNQSYSFITHVIEGLNDLAKVAGIQSGEIFRTPHFRSFITEFIGEDAAAPVLQFIQKPYFRVGQRFDDQIQESKIIGLSTDAWVRKQGGTPTGAYHTSDVDLTRLLARDESARKRIGMNEGHAITLIAYLSTPTLMLHGPEGVTTLEEALEIPRALLEDRLGKVPTIEENARLLEQQWWGRAAKGRTQQTT
ncbi:Uncharacterised protein [uncultured archaeon]|nr:Uncharacterised protein [uncultured archaeon]